MRYPLTLFFLVIALVTLPLLFLATGAWVSLVILTIGFYFAERVRPRF